jgi:hypothetical protein
MLPLMVLSVRRQGPAIALIAGPFFLRCTFRGTCRALPATHGGCGVFGQKSKANLGRPESLPARSDPSSAHGPGMEANHEEHRPRSDKIRRTKKPVPDPGTALAAACDASIRPVSTRASLHARPWSEVPRNEGSLCWRFLRGNGRVTRRECRQCHPDLHMTMPASRPSRKLRLPRQY